MATTKTKKKSQKKTKKKSPVQSEILEPNTYKILWVEEDSMIIKCVDEVSKNAIFRFSKVTLGDQQEDGTIPVSFTTDLIDNPAEVDFKSTMSAEEFDNYLGSLVTNVVMTILNQTNKDVEYQMTSEGTTNNDENRDTDSK